VGEEAVLHQPRLHTGLAQIFLALFALLATFAPGLDSLPAWNGAEDYVSAPADPKTDATNLVRATLASAEDLEEEADEEGTSLAAATFHCASDAAHPVADAWVPPVHRLSAHFCTGPPLL
jgi:hypothetical protein